MPDSTHGVPSKGNGGLIALGVIMLLLAGGLVFWKTQSSDSEPEVVEEQTPTQPAPEAAPVLDHAPPPPPEEEEVVEEEKEEKAVAAGPSTRPSGPAGCSGTCNGQATPELRSALASRGAMARGCYNAALRTNPTLEGKLTVSVRLSPTGTVCGASSSNNTLGDASVASCAVAKFQGGKFPAPQGGCIDTAVPLNFTKAK